MKPVRIALVCAALALFPLVIAAAKEDEEKKPELPAEIPCAVSGKMISVKDATSSKHFIDHEYNRYYFCCENCPKAFAKAPAKFESKKSIKLADLPMPKKLACAVMEDHEADVKEATEKKLFADHNGRRYYFCCAGCPAAFKKDPEKFAKHVSVPIGQLPLPKMGACAVSGKEISVEKALAEKHFADYKGKRYLFCCENCPKAFESDPAKFAEKPSIPSPKHVEKETKSE